MPRFLFLRDYVEPTGGHIKVRDYFDHCLAYPGLAPDIYFTPASFNAPHWETLFGGISPERIVPEVELGKYDLLFLAGTDWSRTPFEIFGNPIINLVQHVQHADPTLQLFGFLKNYAHRVCVSQSVQEAILPHANGPIRVIRCGIPLEMCKPFGRNPFAASLEAPRARAEKPARVLILAVKNRTLGWILRERIEAEDVAVEVITDWIPRGQFLSRLSETDVFVGLPWPSEGFYLPGLEAMACGCTVVCPDAKGNREYCLNGVNCLQPAHNDPESIVACVRRLLVDTALRTQISAAGVMTASRYTLQREREEFFVLLNQLALSTD